MSVEHSPHAPGADPASPLGHMSTGSSAPDPAEISFDDHAKQGWEFFTKFLFSNVIVTILALVFVAILTVWS